MIVNPPIFATVVLAEGAVGDAQASPPWQPMTLLDGLRLLHHHVALLLQVYKYEYNDIKIV